MVSGTINLTSFLTISAASNTTNRQTSPFTGFIPRAELFPII